MFLSRLLSGLALPLPGWQAAAGGTSLSEVRWLRDSWEQPVDLSLSGILVGLDFLPKLPPRRS